MSSLPKRHPSPAAPEAIVTAARLIQRIDHLVGEIEALKAESHGADVRAARTRLAAAALAARSRRRRGRERAATERSG